MIPLLGYGTLKPVSRSFDAHETSTPPIPQPNLGKRELQLKSKDKFTFATNRSCKASRKEAYTQRKLAKNARSQRYDSIKLGSNFSH